MDGYKGYRNCALGVLSGVVLLVVAAGPAHADTPAQTAPIDVRRAVVALQHYAQEVIGELSADLAVMSVTAIGGHVFTPPPPPPTVTGSTPPPSPPTAPGGTPTPPPPPTTTGGGTPTPPPPPTIQGGPGPTPPPPTTQGGPGPSGAPEPATIITGLVGLGIASAAGWYRRRRRR